jgi:hypothetical protein
MDLRIGGRLEAGPRSDSYISYQFRHYCDNATTSESAMLNDKKCPAGKYCVAGLTDVSEATDCTVGKYCLEGKYRCQSGHRLYCRDILLTG